MIQGKKVLAVIPARGGSKGVPRKNIRNVAGKPLIAWTIEEAKKSAYIDRLVLSSEDMEIIEVARSLGCEVPFVRPLELAQDDTPGIEPVLHALSMLPGYDYIVLLQPTSPLRTVADIDSAVELCLHNKAKACVSVVVTEKDPHWMYILDDKSRLHPVLENGSTYTRRQDLPDIFAENGAIYIAEKEWLLQNRAFETSETIAYKMPRERSFDIDTDLDIILCETLLIMRRG
jgi:N-acylneuraminate cytidylyltransferase